jgi:hypothetical protein
MANPFDEFDIKQQANPFEEQPLTAGRVGELLTRGAAPAVAGAMAGGAVAGAPGALIGSMALPIGDVLNTLINLASSGVKEITGADLGRLAMPSQVASEYMGKAGYAEPTSTTERVIEAGGSGMGGVATQLPSLARLAKEGASVVTRNVAEQMGKAPITQAVIAAPQQMTAQAVTEATGSPLAGLIAAMGMGAPFGVKSRQGEVAPTAKELRASASDAYTRSAQAGAVIKPESLQNAGQSIVKSVSDRIAIDPQEDTGAMAVQRRLQQTFERPQTLEQLDLTRQFIRDAQGSGGRSGKYAKEALKEFDGYINNLGKDDILKGDSKTAISALKEARALWTRNNKTQALEDILQSAELRATANYSQSGLETALRRKLVNLADSEDLKFFTKTEQDAIIAAAKGGKLQNFLRWAGKYAGTSPLQTGVGSGMGAGIGALLGGPVGAAIGGATVPAVGGLARAGATQLGMDQIRQLQEMMALGRMPEVIRSRFGAVPATTTRGLLANPIPTNEEEQPF